MRRLGMDPAEQAYVRGGSSGNRRRAKPGATTPLIAIRREASGAWPLYGNIDAAGGVVVGSKHLWVAGTDVNDKPYVYRYSLKRPARAKHGSYLTTAGADGPCRSVSYGDVGAWNDAIRVSDGADNRAGGHLRGDGCGPHGRNHR